MLALGDDMPKDPFYWSRDWRAFRQRILNRRATCEVPGCGKPAEQVDHILSRANGGAELDPANVQALCGPHHSSKTVQADGGFGRRATGEADLRARGCDAAGNPIDPRHRWNR